MRNVCKTRGGDLAWWAVPSVLVGTWGTAETLLRQKGLMGGWPNLWLVGCVLLVVFGIGIWLEKSWARWVGLAVFVGGAAYAGVGLYVEGFSLLYAAMLAATLLCCWQLWRVPIGWTPGQSAEAEAEDDGPPRSLVLLLREPFYLEASILARLASKAWGAEVEVSMDEDDEDDEDDEEEEDDDQEEEVRSCVMGQPPHFVCMHPPAVFAIHAIDAPYFEEVDELAAKLPELRTRQAVLEHQAWLSVDLLHWLDDEEDLDQAYRWIGRLLAELADENCLAVVDPVARHVVVFDPETEQKLRSKHPREALSKIYFAPIVAVEDNDAELRAAVAEARSRWPEFVAAFESRAEDSANEFSVKAPFTDGRQTEYMWLAVTGIENDVIYGVLDSQPANMSGLSEGDRVTAQVDGVNDWVCVVDGEPHGGFTVKVLTQRLRNRKE